MLHFSLPPYHSHPTPLTPTPSQPPFSFSNPPHAPVATTPLPSPSYPTHPYPFPPPFSSPPHHLVTTTPLPSLSYPTHPFPLTTSLFLFLFQPNPCLSYHNPLTIPILPHSPLPLYNITDYSYPFTPHPPPPHPSHPAVSHTTHTMTPWC